MSTVNRFKRSNGIYSLTVSDHTAIGYVHTKADAWKQSSGKWALGSWNIYQQDEADATVLGEYDTLRQCVVALQKTQDVKLKIAA